jgi:hypothetical protein
VGSEVDRVPLGPVLSEYLGFSCHSFSPLIAPQSSPSIFQGWGNMRLKAVVIEDLVPLPSTYINKKYFLYFLLNTDSKGGT